MDSIKSRVNHRVRMSSQRRRRDRGSRRRSRRRSRRGSQSQNSIRALHIQDENRWEHILRGKLENICVSYPGVTLKLLEEIPSDLDVDLRKQIKAEWLRRAEAYREIPAGFVETLCERTFKALKSDQFQDGGRRRRTRRTITREKKFFTRRRKE